MYSARVAWANSWSSRAKASSSGRPGMPVTRLGLRKRPVRPLSGLRRAIGCAADGVAASSSGVRSVTMSTVVLLGGVARIAGYARLGFYEASSVALIAIELPLVVIGSWLGGHLIRS